MKYSKSLLRSGNFTNRPPMVRRNRQNPESDPWDPTQKRVNAQPIIDQYRIRKTKTPFIYTTDFIESDYDLSKYEMKANRIFGLKNEYIPPAGFGYGLPKLGVPEFAFIGRSNVGKSSLISSLLSSNTLVRISREPGCTKSVNYFGFVSPQHDDQMNIKYDDTNKVEPGKHELYLIDLPGYGFAKVSKTERERWQGVIDGYLNGRNMLTLRRTYLLVDARHGVKDVDVKMMLRLDASAIPYQIILTKIDIASKDELLHSLTTAFNQLAAKRLSSSLPYVHTLSSVTGQGIQALKQSMAEIISYDPDKFYEEHSEITPIEDVESHDSDVFDAVDGVADDEREVMISEHDASVMKAIEANMREEEEYDENPTPKRRHHR